MNIMELNCLRDYARRKPSCLLGETPGAEIVGLIPGKICVNYMHVDAGSGPSYLLVKV